MALRAVVIIPIGTVLVEELAFRGTLDALLRRTMSPVRSMVAGALLFGAWHLPRILDDGVLVVIGTAAATASAGVGFIWLRRRSKSLLAGR